MEAITITIEGREVSGYPGMTVLQLAQESGIDIPTLCHDPCLAPAGACRLCLVEDEPSKAILAACVTPIRPGMVINTRSPRVLERRKVIIQLMLASHPDSCLVCDKGNRCQLRKLAADLGIGLIRFQRIPQPSVIEEVNPFIERDLSKCVLCAKCIRADHELVVEGAIDYIGRGFTTRPATLNDVPLEQSECTFCGTCVALCPTGALMEKERLYHGTTVRAIDTVCPYCGCGCGLSLEVKGNRVVRARPARESPVSRGALCVRGAYGYDFIHSADRLTSPLVKTEGKFEAVSWEQALDKVAAELRRIKADYGAESLAILGSSKCTNEENYLLQRFARAVLGTNNIDNGSRLYGSAGRSISFPRMTSTIDEVEHSGVIMVIGADPTTSAPAVGYAIKRAVKYGGAQLLLIDPRPTKLAAFAHLWLKPKPGTDVALINGLARVIIDDRLFDEESVARQADNFGEFARGLKAYTDEKVEKITGVNRQDMRRAAHLLAEAERTSIVYGNGITQRVNGTDSAVALANLVRLTSSIGHKRGILALPRENNAQGACDMGSLPDCLPGYHSLDDTPARQRFEERWGTRLPTSPGLTALEMVQRAGEGKLKGILIVGENPVASFPSPSVVKKALASLELLVVADMFMTETARLATVVLPAASFAEKDGSFTNFEGRVQPIRKAIEPVGHSLPDWEIVRQLANRMGHPMPYSSPQEVMAEIQELVPLYRRPANANSPAQDRADSEGARFFPVEYVPPPDTSADRYPLTLLTGSILHHFGSGTRSSRSSRLKKFSPQAWVEVSAPDAAELGLKDGDEVRVASAVGQINTAVRLNGTLSRGIIFMPISFPESPVYELFGIDLDSEAKTPSLKSCAVRLERISQHG